MKERIANMALRSIKTSLPGVLLIEPDVFADARGFFMETHHQQKYGEAGINRPFVQDNRSHSKKFVLRGLHCQLHKPQGKLVYVVAGEIFDVAVDIRRGSPNFGRWEGLYLSSENKRQLFVPEGFAHGFCVMSETADVLYKCTDFYQPDDEFGILWSDPTIDIVWPVEAPILSSKDSQYPKLRDIPDHLLPRYAG